MIASLRGILRELQVDHCVVDVGGVGYRVFVSDMTRQALPPTGREVFLHIHTNLREDALHLFGFATATEKEMFRLLTAVTGIGPRLGLACLSSFSPSELARAVGTRDVKALTRVPGIGRKTAERLLLELRDKLKVEAPPLPPALDVTAPAAGPLADAIQALVALGYGRTEAEQAVYGVWRQLESEAGDADTTALVRAALRNRATSA